MRDCDGLALPTAWRYNLNGAAVEEVDERGSAQRRVGLPEPQLQLRRAGQSDPDDGRGDTVTERNFNLHNLLVKERRDAAGLNLTTGYVYDRLDNPQTVADPEGIVTVTEYNAFGKLTRQVDDFVQAHANSHNA